MSRHCHFAVPLPLRGARASPFSCAGKELYAFHFEVSADLPPVSKNAEACRKRLAAPNPVRTVDSLSLWTRSGVAPQLDCRKRLEGYPQPQEPVLMDRDATCNGTAHGIRLLISDVDGTLVTPQKALTQRPLARPSNRLHNAGIAFAITSSRPPRGMRMLVEPLHITTPIAAYNGGLYVGRICRSSTGQFCRPTLRHRSFASSIPTAWTVWAYRGCDWFVRDPHGPHVEHEEHAVQFSPTVVRDFDDLLGARAK